MWSNAVALYFGDAGTAALARAFHAMGKGKEKQTVLIVDDEPLIRFDVRGVLEDAGYCAKEASNAEEALRLIHDDGITVVLTDIDMPGAMDGLALAREVRARWPHIAVVVTSGRHLPRPHEMPTDTPFLSKPFSEERLIEVLNSRDPRRRSQD